MKHVIKMVEGDWRGPKALLIVMSVAMPLAFSVWQALLNNFIVERAHFTGVEVGILQSLREVPGFLAFAVVFILIVMREQTLAILSLLLLGVGTAVTGLFPFEIGLYVTTVIGSLGFHYFETIRQSLALQWAAKNEAAAFFGTLISVSAFASLAAFGLSYAALQWFEVDMVTVYGVGGSATVAVAVVAWLAYPRFPEKVEQRKEIVLRARYWLYYALEFMHGARRQIFVVFAGLLMVDKYGYSVAAVTLLFLINGAVNMLFAPALGRLIGRWGERRTLIFEYVGLVLVFVAYAAIDSAWVAAGLYVLDNLFFTMAIAMRTYFQKIADPADIAATSGVAFTISHIVAVVIPAAFGALWVASPPAVFLAGAAMAGVALGLALLIPHDPSPNRVALVGRWKGLARPAPAE